MSEIIFSTDPEAAIYANWLCLRCCWFDGDDKCLCTPDHNRDDNSCFGVLGCANFCKIEES
jgi:hypothetical protein